MVQKIRGYHGSEEWTPELERRLSRRVQLRYWLAVSTVPPLLSLLMFALRWLRDGQDPFLRELQEHWWRLLWIPGALWLGAAWLALRTSKPRLP